jgi:hypothetical protein
MMKISSSEVKALAADIIASFPAPTLSEIEAEFREADTKLIEFLKQNRLKAPRKKMKHGGGNQRLSFGNPSKRGPSEHRKTP